MLNSNIKDLEIMETVNNSLRILAYNKKSKI